VRKIIHLKKSHNTQVQQVHHPIENEHDESISDRKKATQLAACFIGRESPSSKYKISKNWNKIGIYGVPRVTPHTTTFSLAGKKHKFQIERQRRSS
jgi:hypothetical protein